MSGAVMAFLLPTRVQIQAGSFLKAACVGLLVFYFASCGSKTPLAPTGPLASISDSEQQRVEVVEQDVEESGSLAADTVTPLATVLTERKESKESGLRPVALPPPLKPRGVLMVAGVSSLDALASQMAALKPQVGSIRVLKAGLIRALKYEIRQSLALTHTRWLRSDGPVRVFVMSPASDDVSRAIMLPITEPKKLLAAIPAERRVKESGHAAIIQVGKTRHFIDFIDGYVVVTSGPKVMAAVRKALDPALSRWVPQAPLVLHVDTQKLGALYGSDLVMQRGTLRDALVEWTGLQRYSNTHPLIQSLVDAALSWVTSSSELNLSVHHLGKRLELSVTYRDQERAIKDAFSRTSDKLIKHVRPKGWFVGVSNLKLTEQSAWGRLQRASVTALSTLLQLKSADKQQLDSIVRADWKNTEGATAFSAYETQGFPWGFTAVKWVKDSAKSRVLDEQWVEVITRGLNRRLQDHYKKADLTAKRPVKARDGAASLNRYLRTLGIEVSRITRTEEGTHLRGLEFVFTWDRFPVSSLRARMKSLIGNRVQWVAAYRSNRVGFALGPKAVEEAKQAVKRQSAGGNRTLQTVANRHAFAFALELGPLARFLTKAVSPLSLLGRRFTAIPDKAVLSVSGKSDGPFAVFRVSVPASVIRALK